MKTKSTAAMIAFFLGGIGGQHFYLGNAGTGMFYAMFFWTGIPLVIGLFQAISFASMDERKFNAIYNYRYNLGRISDAQ